LLWPLFGATNQLLGGLAFLVIVFWLKKRNSPTWFIVPAAVVMLILPGYAMLHQLLSGPNAWLIGEKPNYLLSSMGIATIALEIWIIFEALNSVRKLKTEL